MILSLLQAEHYMRTSVQLITNNKWETNFRIDCAGFLENRYIITIGDACGKPEEMLEHADAEPLVLRK